MKTMMDYHERTMHRPQRYARSLGVLDWATQPSPWRRYQDAPVLSLARPEPGEGPSLDLLGSLPPSELDHTSVSQLLFDSLAISAWKRAGTARWALRVNPSSGNLHPTEAYLLWEGALHHYAPRAHGLERLAGVPAQGLHLGLTTLPWRESWKYGERALRYCLLDGGHAIASIAYASAALGWDARLVPCADAPLAELLGIHAQRGPEAEHPECLIQVVPGEVSWTRVEHGRAVNRLSPSHHDWPVIDEALELDRHQEAPDWRLSAPPLPHLPADRSLSARALFRTRRSGQRYDGRTGTTVQALQRMLEATHPHRVPLRALPWEPSTALLLFVHRVEGLAPGLYLYDRGYEDSLRAALSADFAWEPTSVPGLHLLAAEDVRGVARELSCHQDIASEGAFAVAMLARVKHETYRQAHQECGALGQVLYLEAEAAGLRGTGIGCFFDPVVHQMLGLRVGSWRSLYHFTVGGAVVDSRIETLPAYSSE